MIIDDVIKDMASVNKTVKLMATGDVSAEPVYGLVTFYKRYSDTNSLITECVDAMRKGVAISNRAELLKASADEFMDIYSQHSEILTNFDFKALVERHLKPYHDANDEAAATATAIWREFQYVSNQLDFRDERADDYDQLRAECDELENNYRISHNKVNEVYAKLREQETKYAALYYFDFIYLSSLISVYANIADSLIKDSQNGR